MSDDLYSAYDLLDVPILALSAARVVYANDATCRLYGLARDELVGANPAALLERTVGPRDLVGARALLGALVTGQSLSNSLWAELRTATGVRRVCFRIQPSPRSSEWLVVIADPPARDSDQITDALVQGIPALMRCQDEQQVLERALDLLAAQNLLCTVLARRGDNYFHQAMRQDPAGVAHVEKLYGQKMSEVPFPVDRIPHMEEAFRTRRATFHPDIVPVLERFHIPPVFAFMQQFLPHLPALDAPIFVEDAPYGVLAVFGFTLTPATALAVELFAQLLGAAIERARNARRAEERLAELQRLQQELVSRERLAILGQASAVVAHEVRNPLGAIINAVAVLKRDRALAGDSAQVVEVIAEEAHRLDRLVGDLLAFARPIEARPVELDVTAVVGRAVDASRPEASAARVALEVSLPEDVPQVRADPDLLQLAIRNLARNAIQASPPNGTVRIEVIPAKSEVLVVVHDEGAGITSEEAERIFAPFFTTRAMGPGLGLAVVDRVVRAHGAAISVGRSPHGGAEFTLRLPR